MKFRDGFFKSSFFYFFADMYEDFRLKVFMSLSESGSFTAAARSLNISQPAVSQNIAELEKQTGVKLFDRMHGYVKLTEQGEIFKLFASRIIKNYEDLNTVFSDYEAFAELSQKVSELSENPMIHLFRDVLSK